MIAPIDVLCPLKVCGAAPGSNCQAHAVGGDVVYHAARVDEAFRLSRRALVAALIGALQHGPVVDVTGDVCECACGENCRAPRASWVSHVEDVIAGVAA